MRTNADRKREEGLEKRGLIKKLAKGEKRGGRDVTFP